MTKRRKIASPGDFEYPTLKYQQGLQMLSCAPYELHLHAPLSGHICMEEYYVSME